MYKKKSIWDEGGTFFFIGVSALIIIILFLLVIYCSVKMATDYRVYKLVMTIKQKIFWNFFIRYIFTSCLKLQFFALGILTFFDGYESNYHERFAATSGIVFIHLAYIRFFMWVKEGRKEDRLYLYTTRMRIGALYSGLRTDYKYRVEWHSLVFFIRRSLFCIITFAMMSLSGVKVMCFIQLSIFYMIYVGYMNFYENKKDKVVEVINEIIILFFSYFFLLICRIVTDKDHLNQIDVTIIVLISTLLVFNIALMVHEIFKNLTKQCKKKYNALKHVKMLKERNKAILEARRLQQEANENFIIQQQLLMLDVSGAFRDETRNPSELEIPTYSHGGRLLVMNDQRDNVFPFDQEKSKREAK